MEPPPEDGGLLDLDGLLDASGCEAGVSAHTVVARAAELYEARERVSERQRLSFQDARKRPFKKLNMGLIA